MESWAELSEAGALVQLLLPCSGASDIWLISGIAPFLQQSLDSMVSQGLACLNLGCQALGERRRGWMEDWALPLFSGDGISWF